MPAFGGSATSLHPGLRYAATTWLKTLAQRARVEECAQNVLDARQPHLDNGATLADLYDPLYMPAPFLKAHQNLDRAVDRCYRREKFETERERLEFLFGLYEEMTAG